MSVQQNIEVIVHMNTKGEIKPLMMKIDGTKYKIIKLKRCVKGITSTCGTFGWLYDIFCDDNQWHRLFYLPKDKIWFIEGSHITLDEFIDYTQDREIQDEQYLIDVPHYD